jgi:hypothetical protein
MLLRKMFVVYSQKTTKLINAVVDKMRNFEITEQVIACSRHRALKT